ncbi:hypothetical protein DID78_06535, partial [Candidatus Marinamargulisbacteria bacterium SCGC AG-343-D04]
ESSERQVDTTSFETFTPKNGQYKFVMSGNSTLYKKVIVRNEDDSTYIDTYFLETNESAKHMSVEKQTYQMNSDSISLLNGPDIMELPLTLNSSASGFTLREFVENFSANGSSFGKAALFSRENLDGNVSYHYVTPEFLIIDSTDTWTSFDDSSANIFDSFASQYSTLNDIESLNSGEIVEFNITDHGLIHINPNTASEYESSLHNQTILALKHDESGQVTHEVKYDRFGLPTIYKNVYINGQKTSYSSKNSYALSSTYDNRSQEDDFVIDINSQGFISKWSHESGYMGNVTVKYSYNSQGLVEREERYEGGELYFIAIYEYTENLKHIKTSQYFIQMHQQYIFVFSEDDKYLTIRRSFLDFPFHEYSGEVISNDAAEETHYIFTDESEYRSGLQPI